MGCSAPPLARAPVNAVTPPAALRASTSPSRGGGEISSPSRRVASLYGLNNRGSSVNGVVASILIAATFAAR